jgi:hypothetical protein
MVGLALGAVMGRSTGGRGCLWTMSPRCRSYVSLRMVHVFGVWPWSHSGANIARTYIGAGQSMCPRQDSNLRHRL